VNSGPAALPRSATGLWSESFDFWRKFASAEIRCMRFALGIRPSRSIDRHKTLAGRRLLQRSSCQVLLPLGLAPSDLGKSSFPVGGHARLSPLTGPLSRHELHGCLLAHYSL
jgi:hypothetical protein